MRTWSATKKNQIALSFCFFLYKGDIWFTVQNSVRCKFQPLRIYCINARYREIRCVRACNPRALTGILTCRVLLGNFFKVPYTSALVHVCRSQTIERVVMFVINFQYRPLRDTVDVPCFNYSGKGWTVHSSQIVLCVFRSFAIRYLMFIKGILSVYMCASWL